MPLEVILTQVDDDSWKGVNLVEPGYAFVAYDYSEEERRIIAVHCSPKDNGGEVIIFPDNGVPDILREKSVDIDDLPVPYGIVEIQKYGRPYEQEFVTRERKLGTFAAQYVAHDEVTRHGSIPKGFRNPN
jgi:hypothetical protein